MTLKEYPAGLFRIDNEMAAVYDILCAGYSIINKKVRLPCASTAYFDTNRPGNFSKPPRSKIPWLFWYVFGAPAAAPRLSPRALEPIFRIRHMLFTCESQVMWLYHHRDELGVFLEFKGGMELRSGSTWCIGDWCPFSFTNAWTLLRMSQTEAKRFWNTWTYTNMYAQNMASLM